MTWAGEGLMVAPDLLVTNGKTDPMVQPELVSIYNELLNEGALTVRLGLLLFWSPMGQLSTSLEMLEQATR